MNALFDLDGVRQHIAKATDRTIQIYAAESASRSVNEIVNSVGGDFIESPIEAIFYVWWEAISRVRGWRMQLTPQLSVEVEGRQRRLDFVLDVILSNFTTEAREHGVTVPRIAIELDGHDFHERTREQVIDRNERDRALQAAGWSVVHFSGSELHRDPEACVEAVAVLADRLRSEFWKQFTRSQVGAF